MNIRIRKISLPIRIGIAVLVLGMIGLIILQQFQEARRESLCAHLWSAAQSGENRDVLQALEEGADPNCDGGKPLRRALESNHPDTAEILRKAGAKAQP